MMHSTITKTSSALLLGGLLLFAGCKKEDTTAPVVSLNGGATLNVNLGGTFTDPGATATDDVDGDISDGIVVGGSVNTNMSGTYTLTYTATDAAGNTGTASRTVVVAATRDSYLGTFSCSENCPAPYGLASTCTISAGATANEISLSLFYYNGGTITLTTDGNNVTINAGQSPNPLGENVSGNGTLNAAGTVISMNLTFTPNGGSPVNCVATYTKN